ncbi:cell adhesion molecule CEACAM6-like [Macrotis lagotis]|uniref:cell adhesion molecule CEACAM6-like n=1 Tax=Macrotis lagotis TaxID=92651 RepID=UPI003D68A642
MVTCGEEHRPMESHSEVSHHGGSLWKGLIVTVSILSCWIQPISTQDALIRVVPRSPYGTVGSNVTLMIQGFSGDALSYNWYRKTTEDSNKIVSYNIHSGVQKPADNRERVLPNGSLLIPNLTFNDTDDYIVQIVDCGGVITVKASGHLVVYEKLAKPNITVNNTNIRENDTLVLTCNTENKGANMLWFFNDQLLSLSERMNIPKNNQTVTIMSVKREDTGFYQCETWNPIGANKSDPIILTVNYGPDHIKILPSTGSGKVVVQLNDSLTLECQTQSFPPAQYEWHVNDTSRPIHSGDTFTIVHAYWNQSGRYTCWARNKVTKLSVSKDITIKVVDVPLLSGRTLARIVIVVVLGVVPIRGLIYFLFFRKSERLRKYPMPP